MNNKLVLFDIDGTLIDSGGAGIRSLNRAFFECFGLSDAFKRIKMAGKTDRQIIREGLKVHGIVVRDAVATGPYSKKSLYDAGADIVVESLEESRTFFGFVEDM